MTQSDIIENNKERFNSGRDIECDSGWNEIIVRFFEELNNLDPKKEKKIFVIKNKFGFMDIQMDIFEMNTPVADLVNKYRDISTHVCESCGKPGKMGYSSFWKCVSCDHCTKEHNGVKIYD